MDLSWIRFLLLFLIKFSSCVLKLHVGNVDDKGKRSISEYVYVEGITTSLTGVGRSISRPLAPSCGANRNVFVFELILLVKGNICI